jgi:thiamine biosynthesis lipoprotein
MQSVNRRQFLLVAGGSGAALAAGAIHQFALPKKAQSWPVVCRKTFALGTNVSIAARHPSSQLADRAIAAAFDELALVERLMSIYRPDSQVSVLNRTGEMRHPHPHLVEVLRHACQIARRTAGAFDVTVQPLWEAFATASKCQQLPDHSTIEAARAKVDWTQLAVADDTVRLLKPGMKITLNGIAQGFAADRVLAALRSFGVQHALINAGELQSLGNSDRGDAWRVGIQHPRQDDAYVALAELDGRAMATSGDYATRFSPDGRHHHILDPRTGYSPSEICSVTILAASGMMSDALSTASFVLGLESSLALIKKTPGCDAFFVLRNGETVATQGFPLRSDGSAS